MNRKKLQSRPWYPQAVAICIGVVLFVLLTRWSGIRAGLRTFFGYFSPVVVGAVLAYIVNPLARLYHSRVFRRIPRERTRTLLANALTFVTVLVFIALALLVILPQLAKSITAFAGNLDGYVTALKDVLESWGLSETAAFDLQSFVSSSENVLEVVTDFVKENLNSILSTSASAGKGLFQLVIGFILSIYLLADRDSLKTGFKRLMRALFGTERYEKSAVFLRQCDSILTRYIVFNLLDSLIVGMANAAFMLLAGMPYAGLVSFLVAITNLLPTFGPIIGAVVGAFVLVLVKPWYALAFLGFTLVLQTVDGYILKPRLFGSSLGVSGLWILIGVIVGGRIFGVLGILMAIPGVAILDFAYREYLLPRLEARRKNAVAPPPPAGDGSGKP